MSGVLIDSVLFGLCKLVFDTIYYLASFYISKVQATVVSSVNATSWWVNFTVIKPCTELWSLTLGSFAPRPDATDQSWQGKVVQADQIYSLIAGQLKTVQNWHCQLCIIVYRRPFLFGRVFAVVYFLDASSLAVHSPFPTGLFANIISFSDTCFPVALVIMQGIK